MANAADTFASVFIRVDWPNDQLTDGGPSPASELAEEPAGPPFGAAAGSAPFRFNTNPSPIKANGRSRAT